jgi:hypothetical protein
LDSGLRGQCFMRSEQSVGERREIPCVFPSASREAICFDKPGDTVKFQTHGKIKGPLIKRPFVETQIGNINQNRIGGMLSSRNR